MLLIDTYNVLHVTGVLPPHLAGLDVLGLARLISFSRHARSKVLLVCDGAPPDQEPLVHAEYRHAPPVLEDSDAIRILHAGHRRDADSLIESLLRSYGGQRTITVVSDDRRLQRAANTHSSRHLTAREFLAQLAHDFDRTAHGGPLPRRPRFATDLPLSPAEARVWARLMGVDLEEPETPPPTSKPARQPPAKNAPALRQPPGPAPKTPAGSAPPVVSPRPADPRPRPLPPGPTPSGEAWLAEAMRMWQGRFSADDLDMERWLREGPSAEDVRG